MPTSSLASLLIATLGCLACSGAHATLGGPPSDFSNAAAVRARQLSATPVGGAGAVTNFNVRESTLDSGTVVREYVGAGGAVFAVAWSGPFLPDLRTLLGAQFAVLTAENAARPRGRRGQVRVAKADVVIESGGHMRAWSGRAWLIAALPAGFDTTVIE